MGLITHSSGSGSSYSMAVSNPRCKPQGSREILRQKRPDVEQQRPRPAQLTIIPHTPQYELVFEKPPSTRTCELFVSLRSSNKLAGNGNNSCRLTSHNTHNTIPRWNAPLSSHFLQPTVRTPFSSLSLSRPSTLGTYASRSIRTSPECEKRGSRKEVTLLRRVPEDGDAMESHSAPFPQSSSQCLNDQEGGGRDSLSRTPVFGSTFQNVEGQSLTMGDDNEEEEEQRWLDEEIARQGLYWGSYRQLVGLYSLTPAFTFLVFFSLAYFPKISCSSVTHEKPSLPYGYSPLFPFPLPEISTAMAFWALSHLLSSSSFSIFSFIFADHTITSLFLGTLFQSLLILILRQAIVPVLLIPSTAMSTHPTWRDGSFCRTWWIALGWAAAEAIVGIKQGYDGIALYRDLLVNVRRVAMTPNRIRKPQNVSTLGYGSVPRENCETAPSFRQSIDIERRPLLENLTRSTSDIATQNDAFLKDAMDDEVERDIDELIALRGREELEDLYGMPFIHIPVFISCLHRLNSVLFVLGSTLLLTAAYMRSSLSLGPLHPTPEHLATSLAFYWMESRGDAQLLITAPLVVVLQWVLSVLHTPQVLPRIGVQTFVYVGLIISLGVFFAGLGVWEGIV